MSAPRPGRSSLMWKFTPPLIIKRRTQQDQGVYMREDIPQCGVEGIAHRPLGRPAQDIPPRRIEPVCRSRFSLATASPSLELRRSIVHESLDLFMDAFEERGGEERARRIELPS
jgi:hypothetical protein